MSVFFFDRDGRVEIIPRSPTTLSCSSNQEPTKGLGLQGRFRAFARRIARMGSRTPQPLSGSCEEPVFFLGAGADAFLAVDTEARLVLIYDPSSGGLVTLSSPAGQRACRRLPWKSAR